MDGIVDTLRLGWDALLLRDKAYEEMRAAESPVVKGLILIIIVGVAVAICAYIGNLLEWATTPDLAKMKDVMFYYFTQMPWWREMAKVPQSMEMFQQLWDTNWGIAQALSPNPASGLVGIVATPVGLIIRWLIYGLLAYLFAIWLGGTANLSETLGVLALAVAPQALNALTIFPYVQMGNLVAIWSILCAYIGLKTVHKLRWNRAMYAAVLPFVLAIGIGILGACLGSAVFAAAVKGG
jgi:hypothetical protein